VQFSLLQININITLHQLSPWYF